MYRFEFVNIELTNICNFDCAFCPQSIIKRKKELMPLDIVKKAVEEVKIENLSPRIHLHLMGEPTLHKDFDSIIDYVDKLGLVVSLFTNGSNLSEDRIDKLLSIKNLEICISLRTLNGHIFNENKCNINFDLYLDNIKKLIIKNVQNSCRIPITLKVFKNTFFSSLLNRSQNLSIYIDMTAVRQLVAEIYEELGISQDIQIKSNYFTTCDRIEILKNIFIDCEMLIHWDSAELRTGRYYDAIAGGCIALKKGFAVLANGDVIPCCRDYNGELTLGNIKMQSLKDILNGDRARFIRFSLDRYRLPTAFCKRCKGGPTIATSLINQLASILGICKLHKYIAPLYLDNKN